MRGMQMIIAFGPLNSEPIGIWIALIFLAICEARQRIRGEFTCRSRLLILIAFATLLAID